MRERPITTKALDWLNRQEGCVAEKMFGCAEQIGRPDINGCYLGRSFRIEMKSPDTGHKVSELQKEDLALWGRCGATVGVAWSLQDVQAIFFSMRENSRK